MKITYYTIVDDLDEAILKAARENRRIKSVELTLDEWHTMRRELYNTGLIAFPYEPEDFGSKDVVGIYKDVVILCKKDKNKNA